MPNLGENEVQGLDVAGDPLSITYQLADVQRPLTSIADICDSGARVVVGQGGGFIFNIQSGKVTPVSRSGKLYELDVWVRRPQNATDSKSGF